MKYVTNAHNIK